MTPRVARVHIVDSDNPRVRAGLYRSIAHADAMLAAAYVDAPVPEGPPFQVLSFSVVWTDGFSFNDRAYLRAQHVRDGLAAGGILRATLLRIARAHADPATYRGFDLALAHRYAAAGRALLARLEADDADVAGTPRNVAAVGWPAPTLLPDPVAAIRRLRDRFVARRQLVGAVGDGTGGELAGYPATNRADVRYVTNWISIALASDLRALGPTAAGVVWNHWRAVRDTIETLLRGGDDRDAYDDNEGLWTRQLPALTRLLDDARGGGALRNARLTFRPVGRRGEPYPPWVAELRGRSGVYVIRTPGASGPEIVYVGSSSADRFHETLTRHFQAWRRWKGYWRGQYGEGHDPGLTYDRDTAEAAVLLTPPRHALELESRLIRRLAPRDNIVGQGDAAEVPF